MWIKLAVQTIRHFKVCLLFQPLLLCIHAWDCRVNSNTYEGTAFLQEPSGSCFFVDIVFCKLKQKREKLHLLQLKLQNKFWMPKIVLFKSTLKQPLNLKINIFETYSGWGMWVAGFFGLSKGDCIDSFCRRKGPVNYSVDYLLLDSKLKFSAVM